MKNHNGPVHNYWDKSIVGLCQFVNYMVNAIRGAYNLSIICILLYLTHNMLIFITYMIELPLRTLINYHFWHVETKFSKPICFNVDRFISL
jgi:hypothetical protein